MLIGKNIGEAFRRSVDARSRLAIWAANHINSPLISKLGLTHIPGGAADASGTKMLRVDGPGLVWENLTIDWQRIDSPYGLAASTTAMTPVTQMMPVPVHRVFNVAPVSITSAFCEMTGVLYDPVYAAESLGLFRRNMDKVSGPKLCRTFCEPLVAADSVNDMVCYDADGNFAGRYVVFCGDAFEAKLFKYTDWPEIGYFMFAPRESAIYAPFDCDGTFTVNANVARANPGMGWLCTAGGLDKLPWRIIQRYGVKARIVWAEFPDDPLLTKNNFAEAFAIATEAKRRCAAMQILRATATAYRPDGLWDAQECLLEDREIKKLARRFRLKIDQVWCGFPGEIDFGDEPQARQVSPFWESNRVAVFYGLGSVEFMLEVLTPRITPWIACGRVLAVVDKKDNLLARRIREASGNTTRVVPFEVFDDKDTDALIEKFQSEVDMILVVPPRGEKEFFNQTGYELCSQAGLPVGIFSRSEDAPRQDAETVHYCVAKHPSADDVFCVKNMNINTITKYTFSLSGVKVAPGAENDMRKE